MESMKYLHKASNAQIEKLLASKITIGELKKEWIQPAWCSYPDALNGVMGCWSLTDLHGMRKRISPKFCESCDCYKRKDK